MDPEQQNWSARKSSLSTAVDQTQLLGRFQWEARLGAGSFGEVFRCLDTETNTAVAVKVERKNGKANQLMQEAEVLRQLAYFPGFPRLCFFHEDSQSKYMGMTLLGESLEDLFRRNRATLTYNFVLRMGSEILACLRDLHSIGYLSRDVKTENILICSDSPSSSFALIDFGLAKLYIDPKTRGHIPMKIRNTLTGTARYASLNAHRGMELSRRDDLESLAYVLLYLLRGSLPWQGLRTDATYTDKYQMIFDVKRKVDIGFICRDLPDEVAFLIMYARALEFEEKPDYAMLIQRFDAGVEKYSSLFMDIRRTRPRKQSVDFVSDSPRRQAMQNRRMSMPAVIMRPEMPVDGREDTIVAQSSRRVEVPLEGEVSVKSKPLEHIIETSVSSNLESRKTRITACIGGFFRCGGKITR